MHSIRPHCFLRWKHKPRDLEGMGGGGGSTKSHRGERKVKKWPQKCRVVYGRPVRFGPQFSFFFPAEKLLRTSPKLFKLPSVCPCGFGPILLAKAELGSQLDVLGVTIDVAWMDY